MTRAIDLQRELLDRLEDRLSLPAAAIVPTHRAQQLDDRDVIVAVGTSLDSTERSNRMERVTARARVPIVATLDFVERNTAEPVAEVQASVVDELTSHSEVWYAAGISNQDEVSHDEQLNRYLGVVEATFECNNQQHPNTHS